MKIKLSTLYLLILTGIFITTSCTESGTNKNSWRSLVQNYKSVELVDKKFTKSGISITPVCVSDAEIVENLNTALPGTPEIIPAEGKNFYYLKVENDNDKAKEIVIDLQVKKASINTPENPNENVKFSWLLYPKSTVFIPGAHGETFIKISSVTEKQ